MDACEPSVSQGHGLLVNTPLSPCNCISTTVWPCLFSQFLACFLPPPPPLPNHYSQKQNMNYLFTNIYSSLGILQVENIPFCMYSFFIRGVCFKICGICTFPTSMHSYRKLPRGDSSFEGADIAFFSR